MKKIIDFITTHYSEILLALVIIVAFGTAILPLIIALARILWDMALNAPLPQY